MGEKLLTIEEAASYLGLAVATLRGWVSRGKIKYVKIGTRAVRFRQRDLDELIEKGLYEPKPRRAGL